MAKEGGGEVEEGARKVQTRAEAMEKKKKEKLKREREVGRGGGADRRVKGGVRKALTMIPLPSCRRAFLEKSGGPSRLGGRWREMRRRRGRSRRGEGQRCR